MNTAAKRQSTSRKSYALAKNAKRARLTPDERKKLIVEEATKFFAEHGFEGSTPELARRLGITQPLLYRYFPTKDDLIEHVYEHAFPSAHYYPKWVALLGRRNVPIRERLVEFYCEYTEVLLNYNFLRLALWARLSRTHLHSKYSDILINVFFPQIVFGLRDACELQDKTPPAAEEIELVQSLHGSIYYVGIRRISNRLQKDIRPIIITKIDVFLDGALALLRGQSDGKTCTDANQLSEELR